jgi:hypothetical protein
MPVTRRGRISADAVAGCRGLPGLSHFRYSQPSPHVLGPEADKYGTRVAHQGRIADK